MGLKNKKTVVIVILVATVLVAGGAAAAYFYWVNTRSDQDSGDQEAGSEGRVIESGYYRFAEYELDEVDVTPSVKEYEVNSDLSNVYYRDVDEYGYTTVIEKLLSTDLKSELAEDQFVITEAEFKEFFSLYEQNRYSYTPSFVTTDSIMHTYHLIFDSTLKTLETEYLYPTAIDLSRDMVTVSQTQYENAGSEDIKTAAKRNIGFFSVGAKLLDLGFEVPEIVKDEVDEELIRISDHEEILVSKVLAIGYENPNLLDNVKEDYTQYIPRGHYTKSDELKRYFKGMMWYGRMTFLAKDKTTTLSALQMTETLKNDEEIFDKWDSIFAPINFFVGKADDLTYYEYGTVYDEVLSGKTLDEATEEELDELWEEIKKLDPPQINSIPVFEPDIQSDRDKETKGFRFFGQRFTIDAMIFQNLVYRDVKETSGGGRKMLPEFLEIPSAMGDDTALQILEDDTDYFEYPNYEDQMDMLRDSVDEIDNDKWTQNLYWSWIYTLNSSIGETPAGYPSFMLSNKWDKKELNTYAGSWTELKHDTILYSKQVYAELGAGGPTDPPDDKGYVEPNVELWRRLLALVRMTKSGLLERDIISEYSSGGPENYCILIEDYKEKIYCNLSHMQDTVKQLLDISVKELTEEKLTDEEYEFIRLLGGDLENMFMSTLDPDANTFTAVEDNPVMLVADVATDPNGVVLEEGTGYVYNIFVVVPIEGELRIARGGVYSHYEFEHPMDDRLTDEKWREMLESGNAPEMKPWQQSIISE